MELKLCFPGIYVHIHRYTVQLTAAAHRTHSRISRRKEVVNIVCLFTFVIALTMSKCV